MCFVHLWQRQMRVISKWNPWKVFLGKFCNFPSVANVSHQGPVGQLYWSQIRQEAFPAGEALQHLAIVIGVYIYILYFFFFGGGMRNRMHMIGVATGQWIMLSEQGHELNLEFSQDDTKCVYDCRIVEVYTGKCSRYLPLLLFGASRCSQRKG